MEMGKPNIIFILLDDYGWADTTCYGSDFYETPNLDRLCAEGMKVYGCVRVVSGVFANARECDEWQISRAGRGDEFYRLEWEESSESRQIDRCALFQVFAP